MTETVSSRGWMTLLGASTFLSGALLVWLAPAPTWARWVALVLGLIGGSLAYRLLVPVDATLTVDARGIRWSVGRREGANIAWAEIRHLRQSADDDTFRLDVGKVFESHIPTHFLRSKEAQEQFLERVASARPDLRVERL